MFAPPGFGYFPPDPTAPPRSGRAGAGPPRARAAVATRRSRGGGAACAGYGKFPVFVTQGTDPAPR
jgi:hypothetical protein